MHDIIKELRDERKRLTDENKKLRSIVYSMAKVLNAASLCCMARSNPQKHNGYIGYFIPEEWIDKLRETAIDATAPVEKYLGIKSWFFNKDKENEKQNIV